MIQRKGRLKRPSPILYNTYTNDQSPPQCTNILIHADDVTLPVYWNCFQTIEHVLTDTLK